MRVGRAVATGRDRPSLEQADPVRRCTSPGSSLNPSRLTPCPALSFLLTLMHHGDENPHVRVLSED